MVVRLRCLIGVVVCISVSSWVEWYTDAIGSGVKGFGGGGVFTVNKRAIASLYP